MLRRGKAGKAPTVTAHEALVRILARRAHTRAELVSKLRARGYALDAIEAALAEAARLAQLEPEVEVAERYALELARKPRATPAWVESKLRAKGIEAPLVRASVHKAFQEWDARGSAWEAVAGEVDPRRAARRLESRGYDADVIGWVVSRLRKGGEDA
jgi:regulatory protein